MIVTRSYLEEYVNLDGISNEEIVEKLNSIGLEVEGAKQYDIPSKVVIGEVVACEKHPDADKLNVCQVDIGSEVVQIICGAKNVVHAKYVAVATIGAVLPGDFKIKKAKLRGIESYGMICSSTELGLPELEDGIMILDDSIGELIVGKELREYKKVADFVVEVDITANRGDALSIYGVARDLAVGFKRDLKQKSFSECESKESDISLELVKKDGFPGKACYSVCDVTAIKVRFLERLRAAFCELDFENELDLLISLAMHESGVLLRAYDANTLIEDKKIALAFEVDDFVVRVKANEKAIALLGVQANKDVLAKEAGTILLEASYIEPEFVVEGVSKHKLESDKHYYNSSRGSEANIEFGMSVAKDFFAKNSNASDTTVNLSVENALEQRVIATSISELNAIIGDAIAKEEILDILTRLGYEIKQDGEELELVVPAQFHEVTNPQDVAEEIVRFFGINNIKPKPLLVEEKSRITKAYIEFREKEALSNRAIAAGFNEAITYAFTSKEQLQKYGFEVLDEELELINPIVKELNTLRSTMFINLLQAVSQNVKYGKKSIALFEVGPVFNSKREESEKLSFIFSGELERAGVKNQAKAKKIDFASFVEKIGAVIGDFSLQAMQPQNSLMHPYQSAKVYKDGIEVGLIAKVHPAVLKEYDIDETFIAEFDLEAILPKHKLANELSNFQPSTKDLSVVVDKNIPFFEIAKVLQAFKEQEALLKDFYPLDIYSDESLGNKQSLTIRFTLQSDEKTLSVEEIEAIIEQILMLLKENFDAELR